MANRQLTTIELDCARQLVEEIRKQLKSLSQQDLQLLFAYRRKVYKELIYDERGKPMERRRLKAIKRKEQNGICPECLKPLPDKYVDLDRTEAYLGYTRENTKLVHHECHHINQARKNYT